MFCSNCGKNIADQTICPYCGYQDVPYDDPGAVQPPQDAGSPVSGEPYAPYQAPAYPAEPYAEAPYPNAPYQEAPYQEAPYPEAPYQEAPYPEAPYQEAPYPEAPYQEAPYPEAPYQGEVFPPAHGTAAYAQDPEFERAFTPDPVPAPKKKKKKGLIIGIISGAAALLIAGGILLYFFVLAPLFSYNKAVSLKDDGDYDEAIEKFTDLGDYKDSAEQITECKYLKAKQMLADGKFDEAAAAFKELGDYEDSAAQIKQCGYDKAQKLQSDGKFDEAIAEFMKLGGYRDSANQITQCTYDKAKQLIKEGKYDDAKAVLKEIADYSDSADLITECEYEAAKELIESDPASAIKKLEDLGNYQDSKELLKKAKMNYCQKNKNNTDTNTYQYLKELKAASYAGASALYDELYTYRVTNVFWNQDKNNHDSASGLKKLSVKKEQVLHFTLEGGTPDDTGMKIQYTITWPSGNKSNGQYDSRYATYTLAMTNDVAGTLKVEIFTQDKKSLYTATVTVG